MATHHNCSSVKSGFQSPVSRRKSENRKQGLRVAIVGATGLVGGELLQILEQRRFPVGELLPFSSGSKRTSVRFYGRRVSAPAVSYPALHSADLVFLASSDDVARRYGPALAKAGVWVIDDSSAFRLHTGVPLVIPEVNSQSLSPRRRLIAGPNCTATGPAVAGYPLVKAAGVKALRLASYQAVSGAGRAALDEFVSQMNAFKPSRQGWKGLAAKLTSLRSNIFPQPIALNLFPQVGNFDAQGFSGEETKIALELRKIWNIPNLKISATAVRVPVLRGHSIACWIETRRPLSPARARALLRRAPGIRLWDKNYPTPRDAQGTWPVHVGRVRAGTSPNELCLWMVSDNLLKGAALNSAQIAETLLSRGWLRA